MRNNPLTAALALLVVIFPIAAQEHPVPPHQRTMPAKATAPVRLSDVQIEAAIRLKLAKSKIGPEKFRFKVQGGVATIEGKTDVVQHKGAATRLAKTAGAVAVNNHIQISDEAKERAAKNLETGRRRAQIKRGDARSEVAESPQPAAVAAAPAKPKTAPKTLPSAPPSTVQKQ
jgi:hypothetical protein